MCADYSDGFTCSSFVIILYLIVRFDCLIGLMLYVPVNISGHIGTLPPFYGTLT